MDIFLNVCNSCLYTCVTDSANVFLWWFEWSLKVYLSEKESLFGELSYQENYNL